MQGRRKGVITIQILAEKSAAQCSVLLIISINVYKMLGGRSKRDTLDTGRETGRFSPKRSHLFSENILLAETRVSIKPLTSQDGLP